MKKFLVSLSFFLYFASACYAAVKLPDIGSSSSRILSLVDEQAIGDDYMRQIRALAPIVNDAEINDYIQHLGFKLVENNPIAQDRQFSFFVIREDTINAFALPGGYIGIHTGLISQTDNEGELASVLGHEIAHVTQRHLARRLELQKEMTIPSLAAFIAAIIVASQAKTSQSGVGALMGARGLAQQAMINHTRSNEAEADRIGIETLYKAGYNTTSAISFFEKMQQNQRYYSNAFEFLRTHPLSRSRITDARLRAKQYPTRRINDRPVYHLMKQKIRALTMKVTPVNVDQYRQRYLGGKVKTTAELYGHAVFFIRAKQFKLAEQILTQLRLSDNHQASYAIAMAQLDIERKTPAKSIQPIRAMLTQSPGNQALVETLAELLLANTDYVEARELLLQHIHLSEKVPYMLKLLAEAQQGSGHNSEVYETEGNFLLAMGDLGGARIQFEQALNIYTEDPYARSRVNAQINKIKEYIRQRSLRH